MDWMGAAYHARKKQVKATGDGVLAIRAEKAMCFSLFGEMASGANQQQNEIGATR
jgi:hypothetical protein